MRNVLRTVCGLGLAALTSLAIFDAAAQEPAAETVSTAVVADGDPICMPDDPCAGDPICMPDDPCAGDPWIPLPCAENGLDTAPTKATDPTPAGC